MDIMTLLMAQRGGGGSGGGSVNSVNGIMPDENGNVALAYDNLTDRPFYKAVEAVCIIDNEKYTSILNSTYMAYMVDLDKSLSEMYRTEPCTVTFDSVTRKHDPFDLDLMGMKFTAYGNVGMFAAFGVPAENTGEPYVLMYMEDGFAIVFTTDTAATEHSISIIGTTRVIHGLNQEYLVIPVFDLTKMGVPILEDTRVVSVDVDTSELLAAFRKGAVKIRYHWGEYDSNIVEGIVFATHIGNENYNISFPTGSLESLKIAVRSGKITAWKESYQ